MVEARARASLAGSRSLPVVPKKRVYRLPWPPCGDALRHCCRERLGISDVGIDESCVEGNPTDVPNPRGVRYFALFCDANNAAVVDDHRCVLDFDSRLGDHGGVGQSMVARRDGAVTRGNDLGQGAAIPAASMDSASVMRICCMRHMKARAVRSTKQNECLLSGTMSVSRPRSLSRAVARRQSLSAREPREIRGRLRHCDESQGSESDYFAGCARQAAVAALLRTREG